MTKRPELTPENHEAVYDYYREPQIRQWLNMLWRRTGNLLYSPDIVLSDETREDIETQFSLGKAALIASNHPSYHDAFSLPAAFLKTQISGLRETGALGKESLFRGPLSVVSEATGSIPVFREKSWPDTSRSTRIDAGNKLIETVTTRLRNGHSMVIMPEGTTSTEESLTQLSANRIQGGVARIAIAATDSESFVLPIGIHYTHDRHQKRPPRHPVIAFGNPITEYSQNRSAMKARIVEGMQAALDLANTRSSEK